MNLAIYVTDSADEDQAREMVVAAPPNRAPSYTDAISVVVMQRLGVTDAFAVDPNFLAALG
jgi:predicted nucleic acid-binding protein